MFVVNSVISQQTDGLDLKNKLHVINGTLVCLVLSRNTLWLDFEWYPLCLETLFGNKAARRRIVKVNTHSQTFHLSVEILN